MKNLDSQSEDHHQLSPDLLSQFFAQDTVCFFSHFEVLPTHENFSIKTESKMNILQSSVKSPLTMTILNNTIKTSAAGFKSVSHVCFDMDGLLLGRLTKVISVIQVTILQVSSSYRYRLDFNNFLLER